MLVIFTTRPGGERAVRNDWLVVPSEVSMGCRSSRDNILVKRCFAGWHWFVISVSWSSVQILCQEPLSPDSNRPAPALTSSVGSTHTCLCTDKDVQSIQDISLPSNFQVRQHLHLLRVLTVCCYTSMQQQNQWKNLQHKHCNLLTPPAGQDCLQQNMLGRNREETWCASVHGAAKSICSNSYEQPTSV